MAPVIGDPDRGLPRSRHPGKVYLESDTAVAYVPETLDPTLGWLEQELRSTRFDGEFAKLAASNRAEQHLVLRLDVGIAVPDEHWFALTETATALPSRPPQMVGRHLTGLWLLPDWGWSIVFWTANWGWHRHVVTVRGAGR